MFYFLKLVFVCFFYFVLNLIKGLSTKRLKNSCGQSLASISDFAALELVPGRMFDIESKLEAAR